MLAQQHLQLMGNYNQWMNDKVYNAAATLSEDDLMTERGAFFGSIFATLNHLAVADTIWITRLSSIFPQEWDLEKAKRLPQIPTLNHLLFNNLPELRIYRTQLDDILTQLSGHTDETILMSSINYLDIKGVQHRKQVFSLLTHVFNHQTHHRGQITTMLTQAGVDIGVTDLNALVPEM